MIPKYWKAWEVETPEDAPAVATFTRSPKIIEMLKKALDDTEETGKEHGFFTCLDKDGEPFVREYCTGTACEVNIKACPKISHDMSFHTHPVDEETILSELVGGRRERPKPGDEVRLEVVQNALDFFSGQSPGDVSTGMIKDESVSCVGAVLPKDLPWKGRRVLCYQQKAQGPALEKRYSAYEKKRSGAGKGSTAEMNVRLRDAFDKVEIRDLYQKPELRHPDRKVVLSEDIIFWDDKTVLVGGDPFIEKPSVPEEPKEPEKEPEVSIDEPTSEVEIQKFWHKVLSTKMRKGCPQTKGLP